MFIFLMSLIPEPPILFALANAPPPHQSVLSFSAPPLPEEHSPLFVQPICGSFG
jgi:hypothetical protein